MDLYNGDLMAVTRAMELARGFEAAHGETHDVEIRIGDSNGELVGTVKRTGVDNAYVFEPALALR